MAGISSLGMGSGLDLNGLVSSLVSAERAPAQNRLNRNQAAAETRLSALGRLSSSINGLTNAVKALEDYQVGRTATSSQAAAVEATATAELAAGTYRLRVDTLARAQSLASATFAAPDTSLGTGTLTLAQDGEEAVIELAEGADTLEDVRDAINASALDITAVIVRDGEQYRLLLTAGSTGTAGAMTLTVSGGADARLASASMDETVAAADASFSINGLELTASSNVIDDVIPGLELTLKRETEESETVTLTVAQDRAAVRAKLEEVVKAYNALVDTIGSLGRADPEGGDSGPLVGDATLRAVQARLGGIFTARMDTGSEQAGPGMMLELGLSVDVNGRVSLNAERLDGALDVGEAGVESLLSAFGTHFSGVLEGFTATDGVIRSRRDGLNAELRRVREQREQLDRRMATLEQRLRAQFMALDATLVQFQSTSDYLAQQLSNLAALRPPRS